MSTEELKNNVQALAKEILNQIDKDYTQRSQTYIDKSLRDIIYTLQFIIETIHLNNKAILYQYYNWLIETFQQHNLTKQDVFDLMDGTEAVLKNYLTKEQIALITVDKETLTPSNNDLEDLPYAKEMDEYLSYLLQANRNGAKTYIDSLRKTMSIEDIYIHIFQNAMYKIGHLWQYNKISVATEHYATIITQYLMSTMYNELFQTKRNGKKLLASAIGNELHEIGIRMVADLFELAGWSTHYLGSNIPIKQLINFAIESKPDIIALSVTLPIHLSTLKEAITQIRKTGELSHTKIMIGGHPFMQDPSLKDKFDADGFAMQANQAIQVAQELLS